MATVLVRLTCGAGVVRQSDGGKVVTHDVREGRGTFLREEDPYQPVKSWLNADRSVVGGMLPPRAASVEVVDDRGRRVHASTGGGAYAAILAQPNDGFDPVVCCRDAAGAPVRRPLPADYPSVRVTDATEACPACGALEYDECLPFEAWRGGRPGPDGTTIPNPIVVCRACGHQEAEGTFYGSSAETGDSEGEAAHQVRLAQARARMRLQRWYSDTMTLRAATFPIYAAEGWPARIGGSDSSGDRQTAITIRHYDTPDADPTAGDRPRIEVTTSTEHSRHDDGLRTAREALESWVYNDGSRSRWPEVSHAAKALWLAARGREVRAQVLAAERSEQIITIDGSREPFLALAAPADGWVAVRRHDDLIITIAAHLLKPSALTIEPIADPAARLLGPQPPDPDIS